MINKKARDNKKKVKKYDKICTNCKLLSATTTTQSQTEHLDRTSWIWPRQRNKGPTCHVKKFKLIVIMGLGLLLQLQHAIGPVFWIYLELVSFSHYIFIPYFIL